MRSHRPAVAGIADDDAAKPLLQVRNILRKAEDCHDFGSYRNVETAFAGEAVCNAADRLHNVAQCAVVDVHHSPPDDAAHVDIQRIAPMDMIVDQRRQQIMSRGNRVEIAGEMQVDIGHRRNLRIAAAGRAALGAETRSERWFAKRENRLASDQVERVGKPDRGCRLALACRGRVDRGDQNQFAARRLSCWRGNIELGFEAAIRLDIIGIDAQPFRNLRNGPQFCFV